MSSACLSSRSTSTLISFAPGAQPDRVKSSFRYTGCDTSNTTVPSAGSCTVSGILTLFQSYRGAQLSTTSQYCSFAFRPPVYRLPETGKSFASTEWMSISLFQSQFQCSSTM